MVYAEYCSIRAEDENIVSVVDCCYYLLAGL
jgi:hypothetical protein